MSEIEAIDGILKQAPFPPEVVDWRIELGLAWTDEPAVYIWLLIDDDVWSREWSRKNAGPISRIARKEIHEAEIGRWPYVSIRTVSEQHEIEQEEAKA